MAKAPAGEFDLTDLEAILRAGQGDPQVWESMVGPDLSDYARDTEFLRDWLANPSAVRPGTEMPDVGLQPDEIEALIAFLNSG